MSMLLHGALPVTLFSLMFAMGLRITRHGFAELIAHWPLVLAVVGSLAAALPVAAMLIVRAFRMPPELGVGVILISASPVGTFSSILAAYGRANLALSVFLTALTSLLAIVTLPLIVNTAPLGAPLIGTVHLPWASTVLRVLLLIGLPVTLGMLVRRWLGPALAERGHTCIKNAGAITLALIFALIIYAERYELRHAFALAWQPVLLLNVCALALGLTIRMMSRDRDIGLCVALAHAIRQEETGLYVAVTLLAMPLAALPLLLNSLIGISGGLSVLMWARFGMKRKDPETPRLS